MKYVHTYGKCWDCEEPATTFFGDTPVCQRHMDECAERFQEELDKSKERGGSDEDPFQ